MNLDKLKQQFEENPLGVLSVGALVATAAAGLMRANTARKNSKSWARETKRRDRMTK